MLEDVAPFAAFADETITQSPLRRAISAACRRPEAEAISALYEAATLNEDESEAARATALALIRAVRAAPDAALAAMLRDYPLGSEGGLALMGLAEALLRTPDAATRNELLRDKLAGRHWARGSQPLGLSLALAGKLSASPAWPLAAPFVRAGALRAVRRMGRAFVLGETMQEALARAAPLAARGYRFSFDMLGEAALTAEDAEGFFASYRGAIQALRGQGDVHAAPGISIKLSALHPRYMRAQRPRVLQELAPRLVALAALARARGVGISIDAEEADRLDLSLDLLEILCRHPEFSDWDGLGFVVQAYGKRAPAVIDFCADLAHRTGRKMMLRLVKGAYWDHEIKQAQLGGFDDFPVYTRKIHTDIAYLACARQMLAAPALFSQFATHNANSIAAIQAMAGEADYEFQCLHGMGEALYDAVRARPDARPCRIYAPVGPHKTLLAYLVRRLLENGANSSFVHALHDAAVPPEALLQDPVAASRALVPPGTPHEKIRRPPELFSPARTNAAGLDLADETVLSALAAELAQGFTGPGIAQATPGQAGSAFDFASAWPPLAPPRRAEILRAVAAQLERHRASLIALLVREAHKTIPDAQGEIREAVDFCRYYAAQVQGWLAETHRPLGNVVCISPWNFPLSIFLGQIAGAFAAGNAVIAKPAEETPEIAAYAVRLLHEAGWPREALHLLQGDGALGKTLVADSRCHGVAFTGSLEAAKSIQSALAGRLNPDGQPVPLIAETGGLNAMILDSTALPEQSIPDILYSAFNSAGQRCSALRLLCVQKDAMAGFLPRLRAAMAELRVGETGRLATDLGQLITSEAAARVRAHIEAMRERNCPIIQAPAPEGDCFVPPTIIEISDLSVLTHEVFGPVLHVLAVPRRALKHLPDRINALGYGLTFGAHGRIEARLQGWAAAIKAGNLYINRNIVGAVVGVQPFGGEGLSGTGPKAGGPLYVHRLLARGPACMPGPQNLTAAPAGERNEYGLRPRGLVFCKAATPAGYAAQAAALAAAGCIATDDPDGEISAALLEGDAAEIAALAQKLAARPGPIVPLHAFGPAAITAGAVYNPAWLMQERSLSINIAAAGGNASLMAEI